MERVARVTVCASSPPAPPPEAACLQTQDSHGSLETGSVTREFWTKGVWGHCLRRRTSKKVKGQDWADGGGDQCLNSSCWGPSWSRGEHWILANSHKKAGPLNPHISYWAGLPCVMMPCSWGQLPKGMVTLGWGWGDWPYSRDWGGTTVST